MQLLHFTVSEQTIYAKVPDRIIIEGTRQFVFAAFALDEEWAALTVYALFENDRRWGPPVKVLLTGDTIAVPPEVLVSGRLRVGLVGLGDGGAVRLTTKRMSGAIPVYQCGGTRGEDAEEMTPELWEQAIASIGPLGALETEDKSNLVAAINEARQTGGGGSGGTSDHSKLSNRDAADQHPIEAITGLEAALDGKQPAGSYLTNDALDGAVDDALAQAKASGEFDGDPGADGKSAYQYAQDGGYTGTEEDFAGKMAAEIPSIDNTLTKSGQAADAEKVGDALRSLSEEIANVADDAESLAALSECGILNPAYQDETFYTDADGAIYTL